MIQAHVYHTAATLLHVSDVLYPKMKQLLRMRGLRHSIQKDVNIIVATAENGVIGRHGNLPWNLPADKTYLKRSIEGNVVVHGTRVYEELGERVSILMTHSSLDIFMRHIFICIYTYTDSTRM